MQLPTQVCRGVEPKPLQTLPARLPDLQSLERGLTSLLGGHASAGGQLTVCARQPNAYASTFPSEIVTCQCADGRELRLFVKYSAGRGHGCYGHRRGVAYEAEVYRRILQLPGGGTPRFYGAHRGRDSGRTWLILEYLDGAVRMTRAPEPNVMRLASEWIGRFHRANEAQARSATMRFLRRYDAEYYLGWVRRTSLFARQLHRRYAWLTTLCERFVQLVPLLMESPATIIHGEYYPQNILFHGGSIYPIDWESAAIACGEIDLASLTDRWPKDIAQDCELEYRSARFPEGLPAEAGRRLDAARLYYNFRWLGDRPDWTTSEGNRWRFNELRGAGERLGLI